MSRTDDFPLKPPAASRRSWWVLGCFVVAVVMTVALTMESQSRLNAEEAMLVGRWYGYRRDAGEHYAWISEFRADRTWHIDFLHFRGQEMVEQNWIASEDAEDGVWRCKQGRTICDTWHPGGRLTWWEKVGSLLRFFEWPADTVYHEEYEHVLLTREDRVTRNSSSGTVFRSARVPPGFVFPDEPMEPEAALKWWEDRQSGRSVGAE